MKNGFFSGTMKRNGLWFLASFLVILIVAAVTLLFPGSSTAPGELIPAAETGADKDAGVQENCELFQTFTYDRCDHVVTRRVPAPVELYHKSREEVEGLYPEWRITEFSGSEIRMTQQVETFCPDHLVLMPDHTGMLCVFENKYGDALMLTKQMDLAADSLPAACREEVEGGMGFDTPEELDRWLESVES